MEAVAMFQLEPSKEFEVILYILNFFSFINWFSIRFFTEYEQLLAEIQQKNLTTCPICSKEFIKKSKLIRHYHTHFSDFRPKFSCVFCGKLFTTQDWCKRHALNCQLKQYQHISHLDLYNDEKY